MITSRQLYCTFDPIPSPPSPAIKDSPAPLDLRAVSFLNRLAGNLTESSSLAGYVAAGVLGRVTQLAGLTRLTASPVANLWTRSWGAQAVAALAGLGVEGAAYPLATRLALEASGRPQDWSGKALGEAFISSYFFMGGLRIGGLTAGALSSLAGAKTVFAKTLIQQGGMLSGLHLGHEMERASGLLSPRVPSLSLTNSLAMLTQVNLAGLIGSQFLGPSFVALESRTAQRIQLLRQPFPPPDSGLNWPGQAFALAKGGRIPSRMPLSQLEEELGTTQSKMAAKKLETGGEDGSGYDQSGIMALRPLNKRNFPITGPHRANLQTFIELLPHPVAVAVRETFFGLPNIIMVNQKFVRTFAWESEWIRGKSVATLFEDVTDRGMIFSRILSNLTGVVLGRRVEFDPTPMDLKMGNGGILSCIGAGLYLPLGDTTYAFGIFTQVKIKSLPPKASGDIATSIRPPPPSGNPPPVHLASLPSVKSVDVPDQDLNLGRSHFREAMRALQNHFPTPKPPEEQRPESDKPK
jgi:hypothetical protein